MKTFKLTTSNPALLSETIQADYFVVQAGHLFFRNSYRGTDGYPQTIRVYAPGSWAEVQELEEPSQHIPTMTFCGCAICQAHARHARYAR